MPNYKELYFKSQAALADAIEMMDVITEKLRGCMLDCEEIVISEMDEQEPEEGVQPNFSEGLDFLPHSTV